MESNVISKPGSEFDGKTLKEVLEIIKDRPLFVDQVEKAKKLVERMGIPEEFKAANRVRK